MNGQNFVVTLFLLLFCSAGGTLFSQDFSDDFESYDAGFELPDDDPVWTTWNETATDGMVTDIFSFSGEQSLLVEDGDDVVALLGITEGIIEISAMVYIPSDHTGASHFILMNEYEANGTQSWGLQIDIDPAAQTIGIGANAIPLLLDTWAEIRVIVDLNTDLQYVYYDDEELAFNLDFASSSVVELSAIDLYADTGSSGFFVDDIFVSEGTLPPFAPSILAPVDTVVSVAGNDYVQPLTIIGGPAPAVEIIPANATYGNGILTVPSPAEGTLTISVTATNENGTAEANWQVIVEALTPGELTQAGELFVDVSADDASAGSAVWVNDGTLNDFDKIGQPYVTDIFGPPAVSFNNDTTNDAYQCQEPAPEELVGINPTRSIEVWVLNEAVPAEETLVAWAYRGGPCGTNMSFNYGTDQYFGAVGHWCHLPGPDIGWHDRPEHDGPPTIERWHHLVYTFDGITTRVYADGIEWNSETLGLNTINTHPGTKITIAAQLADAANVIDWGQKGSLYIGRLRVHDLVLSPDQVQHNYDVLKDYYSRPIEMPAIVNAPESDYYTAGKDTYTWQLEVTGIPAPGLTVDGGAVACTVDATGLITCDVTSQPDSFTITVQATNLEGTDEASWEVTRRDSPVPEDIEVAGELLVWLDASDPSAGATTWKNLGTLHDFEEAAGDPVFEEIVGVPAVTFDGQSAYQCIDNAPASITGVNPTHTVEAWVLNPEIADEETVVSWAKRGGPEGTNMSFNYGSNATFGALGHWGTPDVGWDVMVPEAGKWHHLAWTYSYDAGLDLATTNVYSNGELQSIENIALNAHPDTKITIASQLEADGVTLTPTLRGSLSIHKLRIHTEALTEDQVINNYEVEVAQFAKPGFTVMPADDTVYEDTITYQKQLLVTGQTPLDFIVDPPDAAVDDFGLLTYELPDPVPESFMITVTIENDFGSAEASWTVRTISAQDLAGPPVHRYTFDLDASDSIGGADGVPYGDVIFQDGEAVLNNPAPPASNANDPFPDPALPDKLPPGAYIDLPNGIISALGDQATFEAWITWYGPDTSSWQRIFDFGTSNGGENFSNTGATSDYIFVTPRSSANTLRFGYNYGDLNNAQYERIIETAPVPTNAEEQHVVVVWDETQTKAQLYFNGRLEAEDLQTHMTLADLGEVIDDNNWLGRSQWPDAMFNGSYHEFRIYDRALTPNEILGNYDAGPDILTSGGTTGTYAFVGDGNCDGGVNIADAIAVLSYLFSGGEACCLLNMEVNSDGSINIADAVGVLSYLFSGGNLLTPDAGAVIEEPQCTLYDTESIPEKVLSCDTPCSQ